MLRRMIRVTRAKILLAVCIGAGLLPACVSTTAPPGSDAPPRAMAGEPLTHSVRAGEVQLVLREIGPALATNVALMNGVEHRIVGPYEFRQATDDAVLHALASNAGLERFENSGYEFLAPADYRRLDALDLRTELPAGFTLPRASVAIGADTPMFDALPLLGQAFDTTLVADNAVADAHSGELSLPDIDGVGALEALLKSARLDTTAFNIEHGDGYLFFYAAGNAPRADVIGNRDVLSDARRALLNRVITLRLPDPGYAPNEVGAYASATTLVNVLPALSAQLGVSVTADPRLHRFPVNPCLMNDVTVETALRLLINQWLVRDFVVDVLDDALHIRPEE